jgi:hypothetical protein
MDFLFGVAGESSEGFAPGGVGPIGGIVKNISSSRTNLMVPER